MYPTLSLKQAFMHPMSDPQCLDAIWHISDYSHESSLIEKNFIHLFLYIRNLYKALFNWIEGHDACVEKTWKSNYNQEKCLLGGGAMNVIRAAVLEKSAVNLSIVKGSKYPALEGEYAGKPFSAGGVSLISHPRNPYAPIIHLNVRTIAVKNGDNVTQWIGGGADLTPMIKFEEDTSLFHNHMRKSCTTSFKTEDYEKFKKWADEYYYIPHRGEMRGIGGTFFDFLPYEGEHSLEFLLQIGQQAAHAYASIVSHRMNTPYDSELEEKHLYWRSRYAEFNLVYDRGTKFGLMTGGNTEAILCSMPPRVKW